jgi:hypothetical protein
MALNTLADVDCNLRWQSQGDDIKSFVQANSPALWQAAAAIKPGFKVVVCWLVDLPSGGRLDYGADPAEVQLSGGGKGRVMRVAEGIIICVQEVFNITASQYMNSIKTRYKGIVTAANPLQLGQSTWLVEQAYDYAMEIEHHEFGAVQYRQAMATHCNGTFGQGPGWTWDQFNQNLAHGIAFGPYFRNVPMSHTFVYVQDFFKNVCMEINDEVKKNTIKENWERYSAAVSGFSGTGFRDRVHEPQVDRWKTAHGH